MNPKSGSPVTPVEPTPPEEVLEADVSDPGAVAEMKKEQAEKKEGKYGSTPSKPYKPPEEDDADEEEEETSWIEIELVDEEDNPVPGARYSVTLPDGREARGTLNADGFARLDGIPPGNCEVSFVKIDANAWEKV